MNADLFRFQLSATDKVNAGDAGIVLGLRSSGEVGLFLGAELQARETPQLIVPSFDMRASFALNTGFEAVLDEEDNPTEREKYEQIARDWNDEFRASGSIAGGVKQEIALDADTGAVQSVTVTVSEQKRHGILIDDESYLAGGDGARRSYAVKVTNRDQQKLSQALQHLALANGLNLAGASVLQTVPGANVLTAQLASFEILKVARLADEYEKSVEILQAKEKPYDLLRVFTPWAATLDRAGIATFELKLKFDVATKYTTEKGVVKDGVVFPLEVYPDPDPLIPTTAVDRVTTLLFDAIDRSLEPVTSSLRQIRDQFTTVGDQARAILDQRFSPSGIRLDIDAAAEPVASRPFDVHLVAFQYRPVPAEVAPLVQDEQDVTGRADVPHYGVGGFFTLGPPRTLSAPATLELHYVPAEVQGFDEDSLAIYRMTPSGTWQYLGGVVDPVLDKVTTSITELGTFTLAPPMPAGRPAVTAQVTPAADEQSLTTAVFTSDVILLNTGQVVPDGTLFTVLSTAAGAVNPVEVGTITTPDADPSTPGVQVASVAGRLTFRGEYPARLAGVTAVGWAARGGTTFIETAVPFAVQ